MYGKITDIDIEMASEMALEMTGREANCKSSQDSEVTETSETSSSEEDEDNDTKSGIKSNSTVKSRIEEMYSKLEGLDFKGVFEKRKEMSQFRLPAPTQRPVYKVTDKCVSDLLLDIHRNVSEVEIELKRELGGKEIWKGITTRGDVRLWGTEKSVDYCSSGTYHVPVGGIEVVVSDTLVDYHAIVNITVEEKSLTL